MMLIVCPQCTASYQVSAASLGADGRSVRCASCHTIWFATAAEPALEAATAESLFPSTPPAEETASAFGPLPFPAPETESDPAGMASPEEPAGGPAQMDDLSAADIPAIPAAGETAMLGDAPSIVPPIEDGSAALRYAAPLPGEDIESLAARRERERSRNHIWRKFVRKLGIPSIATTIVLLGGVVLILLAARNPIVKYLPQTASFYSMIGLPVNLRGLDFENIRVTRDMQDGLPVLVVEGKIVSTAKGIAEVPRLRFAIHDQAGKEIYSWTMMPSRTLLASGETLPFRSRLASPPAEGRDVSIRFFNRRDAMSGFR
jgi:predicted Zn finger-like uncharacterized protein